MASSVCLFLASVLVWMVMMGEATTTPSYINYTTVTGYFLQDDPKTNSSAFDYVSMVRFESLRAKALSQFHRRS